MENIERYEQKFLVSPRECLEVARLIAPYCEPDQATQRGPYQVMSLYLDGDHLPLYKSTRAGASARLKLRIRTYDGESAYLEIKRKIRGMVWKSRVRLRQPAWRALFEARSVPQKMKRSYLQAMSEREEATYHEFIHWRNRYHALPQVWVDYMREGYQSVDETYARVTFDTQVRGALPRGYHLISSDQRRGWRWRHLDYADKLKSQRADVIIELKSERSVPNWMSELSRHLSQRSIGVSKYGLAIEQLHPSYLTRQRDLLRPMTSSLVTRQARDHSHVNGKSRGESP